MSSPTRYDPLYVTTLGTASFALISPNSVSPFQPEVRANATVKKPNATANARIAA